MEEAVENYSHDMENSELNDDNEFEHIESVILVALRMRNHGPGHVVDLIQLQADCQGIGFDSREFSSGFVSLLMKDYLQAHGDFAFRLSEKGHKAGEKVLLSRVKRPFESNSRYARPIQF
jgi:hypothetical protein